MQRIWLTGCAALLLLHYAAPVKGADPKPDEIKAALTKAVPLIQKSAAHYITKRDCFSCHHQGLPMLALTTAKAHGIDVSAEHVKEQAKFTADFLGKNRGNYEKGLGQGGQVDTAGYAMWTLELAGHPADRTTTAVTEYLLLRNKDNDHWVTSSRRPPSEMSQFTTAYLAVRALQSFGSADQKERITARTEQVRGWLTKTPAKDNEDRVFRLWALKLAAANADDLRLATQELVQSQRKDGGWSQTDQLESDAYATGSALVALHQAAGLKTDDEAYQRGLKFLLASQKDDGSWHVKTRSKPFQTYFETGFPHEKDQFISSSATCWAVTALALSSPVSK